MLVSWGGDPAANYDFDVREVFAAMLQRPAWHADALCREHPEVNWLPERGQATATAKAICRECKVQDECRAAALGFDAYGIWGGTSARDRRTMTKDRQSAFDRAPRRATAPVPVPTVGAGAGACAHCDRMSSGVGDDRRIQGLCRACYRRFRRAQRRAS